MTYAWRDKELDDDPLQGWLATHWCCCGYSDQAFDKLKELLRAMNIPDKFSEADWKAKLAKMDEILGKDWKRDVLLSILDEAGVVEHGSSVTFAWITPAGRDLLAALEAMNDTRTLEEAE